MDRDLPEGVVDADPPGGWDDVNDGETAERSAEAAGSPELMDSLSPDDPVEGEEARQGTDPDMSPVRGEEP